MMFKFQNVLISICMDLLFWLCFCLGCFFGIFVFVDEWCMYGSWMIKIFEFDEVVFEEWWMNESWIICMKYWVRLVIKSCLKNKEHEKTKYEIQLYKDLWNILWEYEFF